MTAAASTRTGASTGAFGAFAGLRVPRHLFKFMYRLFTEHCNAHSDENPVWQIGSGTFEAVLAVYQRDQDAFDRGVGAG